MNWNIAFRKFKMLIMVISIIILMFLVVLPSSAQIWNNTGPFGSWIIDIEVAAYDSSIVFISTTKGIYRCSTDNWHWTLLDEGFPEPVDTTWNWNSNPVPGPWWWDSCSGCIETNALAPGHVWVSTIGNGIVFSEDNGENWLFPESGIPNDISIGEIFSFLDDPSMLLTRGNSLLFKSEDGGYNWEIIEGIIPYGEQKFTSIEGNPNHIFMIAFDHWGVVMESIDHGDNWEVINDNSLLFSIICDPSDTNRIWGMNEYPTHGIFKNESVDQGVTWYEFIAHPDNLLGEWAAPWMNVDRAGNVFYQKGNGDIIASWDHGETWEVLPLQHPDGYYFTDYRSHVYYDMASLSHDSQRALWCRNGIILSEDYGNTMSWQNDGLLNSFICHVEADPLNPGRFFASAESGFFVTNDYGMTWETISTLGSDAITVAPSNPLIIYAMFAGYLHLSRDGGTTWTIASPGGGEQLIVHPTHENVVYRSGVFRSDDYGETWTSLMMSGFGFDVDRLRPDSIYAAGVEFIRSYHGGERGTLEVFEVPDRTYCVLSGFSNPNLVYIGTNSGLFRSLDNGESWILDTEDIPSLCWHDFMQLMHDPHNPEGIYLVVAYQGVFYKENFEAEWVHVDGPYNRKVTSVAIGADGSIGIGTHGHGVWIYQPHVPQENEIFIPLHGRYFELISTNRVPESLAASDIFGAVMNLEIVYQDDGSIYIPPPMNIDTIGDLTLTEGYQIFCSAGSYLTIEGTMVDPNIEYDISGRRWNWLGYPFNVEVPLTVALSDILPEIVIVMTDDGRFYLPPPLGINTIGNMIPGEGYMIFVQNDLTFVYNSEFYRLNFFTEHTEEVSEIPEVENPPTPTGLPYLAVVKMTEGLQDLSPSIIEIYDRDLLVGKGIVQPEKEVSAVVAWGGDKERNLQGFENGHPITVKILSSDRMLLATDESAIFGENPYAEITMGIYSASIPSDFIVGSAYPNPFNPAMTVPFALPRAGEVTITLFNLLGQQIYQAKRFYNIGQQQFAFNGSTIGKELVSGMYIVQVAFEDIHQNQKIVLLK